MSGIIVYWSGTGNTEAIANKLSADTGYQALSVSEANSDDLEKYDVVVFGCPAMGAEELEEDEFKPFFEASMRYLAGKNLALFGSYGWGDGEWMRNWKDEAEALGGNVVATLTANGDDSALDPSEYSEFLSKLQ